MDMRVLLLAVFLTSSLFAGPLFRQSEFTAGHEGWTIWSARPETAPRVFVDAVRYRGEPGSLAISGNGNSAAHGGWERRVDGVTGQAWYRFAAYYRAAAVGSETWQVVARLDWRDNSGKRAGQLGPYRAP